jgi:DNA-binding MarR family transcriptional regulator
MGLTRQAVQRTVNVLAEEGRLEARDNPAHRRAPLIMTTPAGKAAYVQAIERQDQWTERLAPHFSENDLQRTLATLRRLRELADGSEG